MPIIPAIGRKSFKMRGVVFSVYAVLIVGSVTTVYPFLMMISSASTSRIDFELYGVPPRYVYNEKMLMARYLDEKYKREIFDAMKFRYMLKEPYEDYISGQKIIRKYGRTLEMIKVLEAFDLSEPKLRRRLDDWYEFKATLALKYKDTYFHAGIFPIGESEVAFQDWLRAKYPDAKAMAKAVAEQRDSYIEIFLPYDAYERHSWYPAKDPKSQLWQECRATLPEHIMCVMTAKSLYQKALLDKYDKIEALNAAWGTSYGYFWQAQFPFTRPDDASGADWEEFVRKKIPMRYVKLDIERCRPSYAAFLKDRYGTVEKYNGLMEDNAASLEDATLAEYMPEESLKLSNWTDYYENAAPIDGIIVDSADVYYAKFLADKYKDVDGVNDAYGTAFASLWQVDPPWREQDYDDLTARKSHIIWNYLTRNYVYVFKRVFLMGRPLINTFILVVLTVLIQVTINPLAAYALSRYKLRYSAKVLIFMLATMAFPAEVAMIPNFLMIRDLGLLNTFAALILPGLASGYYVFLLKGFFDSLPQELYESASIDGASEFRMFWTITLPLSLPVLSVIALFAFGGAYGSFLWAFTTCQDKKMWTLMVFLQQFSGEASASCPYLVMAALVLAAIPTMIVFLSAQKVLMKGIVVPTMK